MADLSFQPHPAAVEAIVSLRIKSRPDRAARKAAAPAAIDHRWAHRAARKLQHEQLVAAEARA